VETFPGGGRGGGRGGGGGAKRRGPSESTNPSGRSEGFSGDYDLGKELEEDVKTGEEKMDRKEKGNALRSGKKTTAVSRTAKGASL